MENFQHWIEPLLWVVGTLVSLATFVRVYKPVWNFLKFPKEIADSLTIFQTEVKQEMKSMRDSIKDVRGQFDDLNTRLDLNDQATLSLLRDRILQFYYHISGRQLKGITQEEFESVVSMFRSYERLGGNSFIHKIMQEINVLPIISESTLGDNNNE